MGNSLRKSLVIWRWWVIVFACCDLESLGASANAHASPGLNDGAADDVRAAADGKVLFAEEEAICNVFGRFAVMVSPCFWSSEVCCSSHCVSQSPRAKSG